MHSGTGPSEGVEMNSLLASIAVVVVVVVALDCHSRMSFDFED